MAFGLKERGAIAAVTAVVLTAVMFGALQRCEVSEPVSGSPEMPIRYIGTEEPVLDYPHSEGRNRWRWLDVLSLPNAGILEGQILVEFSRHSIVRAL
jgi:hypothetical protein